MESFSSFKNYKFLALSIVVFCVIGYLWKPKFLLVEVKPGETVVCPFRLLGFSLVVSGLLTWSLLLAVQKNLLSSVPLLNVTREGFSLDKYGEFDYYDY